MVRAWTQGWEWWGYELGVGPALPQFPCSYSSLNTNCSYVFLLVGEGESVSSVSLSFYGAQSSVATRDAWVEVGRDPALHGGKCLSPAPH